MTAIRVLTSDLVGTLTSRSELLIQPPRIIRCLKPLTSDSVPGLEALKTQALSVEHFKYQADENTVTMQRATTKQGRRAAEYDLQCNR